jgi:hypothetical protein
MACRCVVIIGSLLDFAWPRPAFQATPEQAPLEQAPPLCRFYPGDGSGWKIMI